MTCRLGPPGEVGGPLPHDPARPQASDEHSVTPESDSGKQLPVICPDCAAEAQDRHITHETTCPLGIALDAIIEADRAHFEKYPGADVYRRRVQPAEIAELRTLGMIPSGAQATGFVTVRRLSGDLRARSFDELTIVPSTRGDAR